MTRRLRFDPEARAELDEAALRYDRQAPGVGDAFAAAVRDTIEAVTEWPGLGAPVSERRGGTLRQIRVHRFPYHVGYVATDEELQVVAIAQRAAQAGLLDLAVVIPRLTLETQHSTQQTHPTVSPPVPRRPMPPEPRSF